VQDLAFERRIDNRCRAARGGIHPFLPLGRRLARSPHVGQFSPEVIVASAG
jgi:hypothetical protein